MKFLKSTIVISIFAMLLSGCDQTHPGFKKNENNIYYKVFSEDNDVVVSEIDSGMFWSVYMSYGTPDSLLFDGSKSQKPFEIPYAKPEYEGDINEALSLFKKGDSAVFIVRADSFFLKTANYPEVPELFKESNDLYFWIKMDDILTLEQLEAKNLARLEEMKSKELADLNVFLSRNYPDLQPTESGIYIITEKSGKGILPKTGDMLNLDFEVSTLDGPLLYNSVEAGRPVEAEKGKPFETEGFTEALNSMRVGDEIKVIVPSKMAFKEHGRRGMIDPYTTMSYWIRLNSFKTKEIFEKEQAAQRAKQEAQKAKDKAEKDVYMNNEATTIANYISSNNITVSPTNSGLYYIETAEGEGQQAKAGDKVKVHYAGTLLDGTKFDSSYDRGTPFEFTLGQGSVIKGWDEGIAMMKVGGKATLIVPSNIAYGGSRRSDVIHPYAPLKFDVELVEIVK
jgi:FKBP-type peptidyl-prolyl cis-trans isomerase FkpA